MIKKIDKTVDLAKADTNILSQQEQIEAQLEAQKYLLCIKPMWKFPENFAEVTKKENLIVSQLSRLQMKKGKTKLLF